MKTYIVNDNEFKVTIIIKKKNKNIYFRYKSGAIQISSPKTLDDNYIISMIKKHYKKLVKMNNDNAVSNSIHYLGKEYKLVKHISHRDYLEFSDDVVYIYTTKDDDKHIYKIIYSKYMEILMSIIEKHHMNYEKMFCIDNVRYAIKDVKTYYGQCNVKQKIIILSAKLAKYEEVLILSVLAHELAHFKYQDHSQSYYNYLESIIPGYRMLQKQLKRLKYHDKY